MDKQTKSLSNEELIESLIEIGGEIEAEHYNDKFGQYRQEVVDILKIRALDIKAKLSTNGIDANQEAETNEDLEYALQFI